MKEKLLVLAFALCLMLSTLVEAGYTFVDGKIVDSALVATLPMEEHYRNAVAAYELGDWREAAKQFGIVAANFPLSPYGQEAHFYQGVSNYQLQEYDIADQSFTEYLQGKGHPRLFEETMHYKFAVAESFRNGAKRRFMGTKQLPKWASADGHAIKIYEEIIAAVPCHELAIQSLFSKGLLHCQRKEYTESVESFRMLTKRFPKHELTPECYLMINAVYLEQCKNEFQNPDILAFAKINTLRFAQNFPREERLSEAEAKVLAIKEVYAAGLYDTGQFYERIGYPFASALYYRNAALQFPETQIAELSRKRLEELGYEVMDKKAPEDEACEE